ncbi:hypothetical protein [Streptomyces sp. NPDC046909]|uniref:hypothetical protein n=1 Tax=Streptomyces sp. NPDC046909 TaxID=3155617 RepID=UPI0033EA60D7
MSRKDPREAAPMGMGRRLPLLMALACGVSVANVYFPQGFNIAPATAAVVATVTQLGYAVGLFLLVPLGDRLPHRPLITGLLAVTGIALLAAGLAPASCSRPAAWSAWRPWSRNCYCPWPRAWSSRTVVAA